NTSGMAVGGGYVWMVANAPPEGVFQVDMNSKLISHRQIPLGPANDGGGCHGAMWQDGKLWIASPRLRGDIRGDPQNWQPEFMIPFYQSCPDRVRYHGIAWDNGTIWQVVGNDSKSHIEYKPGLVRYDAATGKVLETVDFVPGSSDPHGLAMHDGKLISCDAGIHPGWPNNDSPTAGWICQIDFVERGGAGTSFRHRRMTGTAKSLAHYNLGSQHVYQLNHPDLVRQILVERRRSFTNRDWSSAHFVLSPVRVCSTAT